MYLVLSGLEQSYQKAPFFHRKKFLVSSLATTHHLIYNIFILLTDILYR